MCYINDLPYVCPKLSTILYADDTTFTAVHQDYQSLVRLLNSELTSVKRWADANRLSINSDKTVSLLITNRGSQIITPLRIKLEESILFYNCCRFLGLEVDYSLKFDFHIGHIQSKLSRIVGIFYRIRDCLCESQMIKLYYSLIYPYLTYGNEIWGGMFAAHIKPLLLIQKKVVRIITRSDYLSHSDPLFYRTGILKMQELHTYVLGCCGFKQHRDGLLGYPRHRYSTRTRHNAIPAYQRLTVTQRSMSYSVPYVWNSLPVDMRHSKYLLQVQDIP